MVLVSRSGVQGAGLVNWATLHGPPCPGASACRTWAVVSDERDWNKLFPQEDDEGTPCPAEDELALQDNGFLSRNEVLRSKVSRLTERLRKRYPTNNFGMAEEVDWRGVWLGRVDTWATGSESKNCGHL